MLTKRGNKANPTKCQAHLDMRSQTNIKEVQRLNRQITALSQFLSKAVDKYLAFYKNLTSTKELNWDDHCELTFQNLRNYLIASLIWSLFKTNN